MLLISKPRNSESVRNTASTIFNYTLKPRMQKSCTLPLPKHPKNKCDMQCISKQNIDRVCIIA